MEQKLANIFKRKKIKKFIQIGSSIEMEKLSPSKVNILKKSSGLKSYYGRSNTWLQNFY